MNRWKVAFCVTLAGAVLALATPAAAAIITYQAVLSGPAEDPPNASPGTGTALVIIDTDAHTMTVSATFADLLGTTTAAHIHGPTALPFAGTAGVATQVPSFDNFPLGATGGAMPATTFDLLNASSYNPAFVANNGGTPATAEAALLAALDQGRTYFNIHSTSFGSGEIRGFLVQVPEPATLLLLGAGFAAGGYARRRRRQ